jgi:hypothetical protein
MFPDTPITRNYKTKENSVGERIRSIFPNDEWRFDKSVPFGCSRKRPDVYLDLRSHLIIVEIDEHRHSSYDCSCENKRLMQLSQDVGHRAIVFLRFNPDANDTSASCWSIDKRNGLLTIKKKMVLEWEMRLDGLINQIQYWKDNTPTKMIEIIQMYY